MRYGGHWVMDPVKLNIDQIVVPSSSVRGPRDVQTLQGLADSLTEVGLLQPILVRRSGEQYELVAGLRRLLAARQAGLDTIDAIILAEDVDTLQIQLIENLQREDLNPVERAQAVHAFIALHNLSKSEAAKRLGIPRTTLTDWLDLLEVPQRFRDAVVDNFNGGDSPLTPSHVSEALALGNTLNSPHLPEVLLDAVLKHKLSKAETRQVAKIIRQQRDTSIEEAIRAIRFPYWQDDDEVAAAADDDLWPHEENLQVLVHTLARSTRMLERMNHISGRFLSKETVSQLVDHYLQISELTERAIARLRMEDPELLAQIEREAQLRRARRKSPGLGHGRVS